MPNKKSEDAPDKIDDDYFRKIADEHADFEDKIRKIEDSPNYIDKLASEIYAAKRIVDLDVAYICASNMLSSVLPYVRIKTSIGDLPLNEMSIIIGASGTGKTLPFRIVKKFLRGVRILFPGRYTVEGVEAWFANMRQEDVIDERGRIIGTQDTDEYLHPPYSSIVTDELSQAFKESKKEHMTGSVELLSQIYDCELKGTALAGGERIPQAPIYVTFLGATVPDFVPSLPEWVFKQGLAGRLYWKLIEPSVKDFDIRDYVRRGKAKEKLNVYDASLKFLLNLNVKDNPNQNELYIKIEEDAGREWNRFRMFKENQWLQDSINYPNDFTWQYKKRLHELVLKKAGLIAVARCVNDIMNMRGQGVKYKPQDYFDIVSVEKEDMIKAIDFVNQSEASLKKIMFMKKTGKVYLMGPRQALSEVYSAANPVDKLLKAPKMMLNAGQLYNACGISDMTTFQKYLNLAIKGGYVKTVHKSEIKDKKDRERLRANVGRTKILTLTEEAMAVFGGFKKVKKYW